MLCCTGVYDLIANMEENKCSMTYMYEYPEYIKIEMSETISQVSLFTRVRLINYYLSPRSQNHDRFINFVLLKKSKQLSVQVTVINV